MASGLPRVHLLATGGTISFVGRDRLDLISYGEHGSQLGVSELVSRLPELRGIAEVTPEQLYQEDYVKFAVGSAHWPAIARRCNDLFAAEPSLGGIVITHGSAAVEETAYFLSLTVRDDRPVVLTASLRPITAMSNDSDLNLIDAVRVAASDHAHGKGALVVLNNEIHSAREATKGSTYLAGSLWTQ